MPPTYTTSLQLMTVYPGQAPGRDLNRAIGRRCSSPLRDPSVPRPLISPFLRLIYTRETSKRLRDRERGGNGMKKWNRGAWFVAWLAVACVVGGAARMSALPRSEEPVDA